jgi:predicted Rossmann-fold nucleotide-binding protein
MNEIETIEKFEYFLRSGKPWDNVAVQGLDLSRYSGRLLHANFTGSLFLGCGLNDAAARQILKTGGLFFPDIKHLPYKPFRGSLYTRETLFDGFDPQNPDSYKDTTDYKIYRHYRDTGRYNPDSILETLTRRLHDHAISDALYDFLDSRADKKRIVAIMGGHSLSRNSLNFLKAARISRLLARAGYLPVSGGGPGAMEATHLGARFAAYEENDLSEAVRILAHAPLYHDPLWLSTAYEVIEKFPARPYKGVRIESIGIPTWLYGHEPATPFATKIAKYFANSVREEGLLAIAEGGVIFAPGSAGTIQEIFQDACKNHYESFGAASPMVFLDETYWRIEKPVYPLLAQLAAGKTYARFLSISDEVESIVTAIKNFKH